MRILITGASNGMGRDFAKQLSSEENELILVSRSKDKLESLKNELKGKAGLYGLKMPSYSYITCSLYHIAR